jgi:hypothetical protein
MVQLEEMTRFVTAADIQTIIPSVLDDGTCIDGMRELRPDDLE